MIQNSFTNAVEVCKDVSSTVVESRSMKAISLFKKGFNCSQAVFLAFHDLYNIDYDSALRLSSSFGGGMGRLREVCGAVSGMFLVAGLIIWLS